MHLCEICKKNQATIHLTDIVKGKKIETHLCAECAQAKGLAVQQTVTLSNILAVAGGESEAVIEARKTKCPECGMTWKDFETTGRLGCSDDYKVFREVLEPLIIQRHSAKEHVGKVSSAAGERAVRAGQLRRLHTELRRAVEDEHFEVAAEVRDRIRALGKERQRETSDEA